MTDTQGLTSPNEIPEAAVRFASEALGETAGEHRDAMAHAAIAAAAPLIVAAATGDATAIYARVCSAELVERLGRDGLERLVREVLAAVRKAGVDEPAESAEPQIVANNAVGLPRVWRASINTVVDVAIERGDNVREAVVELVEYWQRNTATEGFDWFDKQRPVTSPEAGV